ncbi:hypothetical protein CHELA1G11_21683 [Hyphomicrobiales bacterium]|nr:hypothetical protein CHELA1G11_21683 [Hyphomicrobiales bacterium]CAH1695446.1 hypothetical protein CHELA1G2_21988 [Hyphomicrobiales bacterium]
MMRPWRTCFHRAYGTAAICAPSEQVTRSNVTSSGLSVEDALARLTERDRTTAMVRTALLLMKAGTGRASSPQ